MYITPEYEPDSMSGRLRSPLSCVIKHSFFVSEMFKLGMQAERNRTHPMVLLQHDPAQEKDISNIEVNEFGERVLWGEEINRRAMDSVTTARALENNTQEGARKRRRTGVYAPHSSVMDNGYVQEYQTQMDDNKYVIPHGLTVGSQAPMAESRNDLLNFEHQRREDIFALLQLPMALLLKSKPVSSSSLGNSGGADIDETDLLMASRTISYWKDKMVDMFEEVYKSMLGLEESDIDFKLVTAQFINSDILNVMYDQNIISEETYKHKMITIHGMDIDNDLSTKPNKFDRVPANRDSLDFTSSMMNLRKQEIEANIGNVKATTEQGVAAVPKIAAETKKIKDECEHIKAQTSTEKKVGAQKAMAASNTSKK